MPVRMAEPLARLDNNGAMLQTRGMIDGNVTTHDWQTFTGSVCVLPVGSFEQHGYHLPLDTDIFCANYFARMIAEDLDAALLPPLPFGTCMEHTGYRGSFSLRPETLMQTVRDIAEEAERQNFRILIVVNGHGGNFSLGPVVRDINRRDGKLKLLLFDWWDVLTPDIAGEGRERGMDIHAGEMETSLMMALRPESVGVRRCGSPEKSQEERPLTQRDLNSFGTGHYSPAGAVGFPELATPEKGEQVLACVRERLLPIVRDRVRRMEQQPRYAGRGAIAVRAMAAGDLQAAMRLKSLVGWNQTEDDWRIFLGENPEYCLVAVHNGEVVGTTTAIGYGTDLAWVGMVLVDPACRRLGIGTLLLEAILERLKDYKTVGLDATRFGKELYAGLGFREEYELLRLVRPALPFAIAGNAATVFTAADEAEAKALDEQCIGADRGPLLTTLRTHQPSLAWVTRPASGLSGFCLGRSGTNYQQIGPLVASSPEEARTLTEAALGVLTGQPVVMDVPATRQEFISWLQSLGFSTQRRFIRMVRGQGVTTEPAALHAIVGPEFG